MPVVRPYPIGEVEARPVPNAYPSVGAAGDVGLFGGNQARDMQVAGAQVEKASDNLMTIALRQQALQDEADAKAADAGLANDVRTLLFDPEKGYYAKRGKEAIDGAPAVLQALDGLKQKYSGGLKTDSSRRLFTDVADRRITGLQTQIGDKVITERRTYSDQASAARVQNFVDDAGVNFPDQKRVEQAIAGARSEILSQAEITHEPPEVTQSKLRVVESKAITDVVKRWAEEDPYKAKAIRDANNGRIDAADGMVLDKILKEQLLRRGSQDRADDIRRGSASQRISDATAFFRKEGYTPAQAAAIVGNLHEESGGLNPRAVNRGDGRDGSDSIGVAQWNADRAKAFQKWAADNKLDPDTLETQYRFVAQELKTTEKGAGDKLRAAKTVTEANDAMIGYLRPQGSERGASYAHNYGGRLRMANQALDGPSGPAPELDSKTGRPTLQWQLEQAERIKDGDLRDATMQRIRLLHGQDEAVVNEARKKAGEEVMGLVMGGKLTDPGQIPVDKWAALDPVQQRTMQSMMEANAKGKDNPPNPALYAELSRQLVEDPDAFKKRDLVPLANQLPNAHWTHFQNLQVAMGRRENAEEEKRVSISRALQVSDALLKSAGIYLGYADTKGKVTKAKDFDDFKAQYQYSLLQEIERFQSENKRRPNDDELTKMGDRLLLQGRLRGTGFFSEDRAVSFQQRPGEGSPQFYMRYSDIPPDRRKTMEDQLKAKGLPADKSAVEKAYTAWRMQGNR